MLHSPAGGEVTSGKVQCVRVRVCVCVCARAPALVSRHVTIFVPVDIDLCRKREWDLTHDHFPPNPFIVKVCQCTVVDVRWAVTLFEICSSTIGLFTHRLTRR